MKLVNEAKNKAVITTTFVMKQNSPITYVSYDEDGDWQLFGDDDFETKDTLVISIEQILQHDPTLVDIPDMEKGESVSRINTESVWIKE